MNSAIDLHPALHAYLFALVVYERMDGSPVGSGAYDAVIRGDHFNEFCPRCIVRAHVPSLSLVAVVGVVSAEVAACVAVFAFTILFAREEFGCAVAVGVAELTPKLRHGFARSLVGRAVCLLRLLLGVLWCGGHLVHSPALSGCTNRAAPR